MRKRNHTNPDASHADRNPFVSVTMRPTVKLGPDAFALVEKWASMLGFTPEQALAYMIELKIVRDVRLWEKRNPDEYAEVQARFWERVESWQSIHRKGKEVSK